MLEKTLEKVSIAEMNMWIGNRMNMKCTFVDRFDVALE